MIYNTEWVDILKAIKKRQGNSKHYTSCLTISQDTTLQLEEVQRHLVTLSELDYLKYTTQHGPGSAFLLEGGVEYLRSEAEARHLSLPSGKDSPQETSSQIRTILFLASNPTDTARLRLDQEARQIEAGLERARRRDQFKLVTKWAVTDSDLLRALLDHEPEIVHFSGHGGGEEGLKFDDGSGKTHLIPGDALARLFTLCSDHVKCVVLNACYAEPQAEAIVRHIDYVVGMSEAIGDEASIRFSVGFYDALGAGRSLEQAFEFGKVAIGLRGISESQTPVLKKKR